MGCHPDGVGGGLINPRRVRDAIDRRPQHRLRYANPDKARRRCARQAVRDPVTVGRIQTASKGVLVPLTVERPPMNAVREVSYHRLHSLSPFGLTGLVVPSEGRRDRTFVWFRTPNPYAHGGSHPLITVEPFSGFPIDERSNRLFRVKALGAGGVERCPYARHRSSSDPWSSYALLGRNPANARVPSPEPYPSRGFGSEGNS